MRPLFNRSFDTLITYAAPSDSGGGDTADLETFELLNAEEPEETLDLGDKKKPQEAPKEEEGDDDEDNGSEDEGDEEEVDELKELEEELDGPKEEDLELTTPVRRKEILAKYPKLFKDFPYLEKAYYREQQFTEVYPTIQDAKNASNKAQILDQIDGEVMSGDISSVLRAAKQQDNEIFLKIADNYLPTLKRIDQQAYYHVMGNVIKDTIITMVKEGRALGEQGAPLQAAANILNQFIFGSQQFQPPTPLSRQTRPDEQHREQQIRQEEQQRFMGQFETVKTDLQTRADNVLKSTIDQNIDPKKSMTEYVRKNATREAFETLESLIDRDTRFRGLLDRLWEKAFEQKFDKDSTDKIKSAYLSKAKTLLPSVIKKARNDALKGLGRRTAESSDTDQEEESTPKKGPIKSGRSATPPSGKIKKASDIPRGMSTLDVLMRD